MKRKYKLQLKNITKNFKKKAIDRVNLNIRNGEVLTLIGPSGSGKSTLLRILAGLEIPNQGEVYMNGKSLFSDSSTDDTFSKIGLVFQGFNLFPNLSVIDNLIVPLKVIKKLPKDLAQKKAEILLRDVGLDDKYRAMPANLSGGQKQRVAIARMLAIEPEIILFDEPTSALDPEWSAEILFLIQDLVSRLNLTTVIVSHEIAFAKKISDRIVFLENGKVIDKGGYTDIIKNERVKNFLSKLK